MELRRVVFPTLASAIMATGFAAQAQVQVGDQELGTVVVTASGSNQDIKDAPASISVVTREELDRAPVNSLAEVLGTLPGVVGGYATAGAGSKISFRGMPDKYTLILVDGKRIGSSALLGHRPDTLKQDLNWLSPDDIERIEVVRGAMSTLYGSEAMGGVINIITKKVAKKWGGSLTSNVTLPSEGGRGDTYQNSFSVSGPLAENLGLRLGGSYLKRAADNGVENGATGSKDANLNAKLDWQLNAQHSLSLEVAQGQSRSIEFSDAEQREQEGDTYELFGAEKMTHRNFAIGHQGKFGDVNTKLDFYVNTYENESGADTASSGAKSKESVLDFKIDTPAKFGVDQLITAGIQYKKENVENPSNIGTIANFILEEGGQRVPVEKHPEGWAASLFLEDQLFLRDNLTLTLGVRGDKSDGYGLELSPRAYAVYHPSDVWTVKGGISQGYRAPNLKERSLTSGTMSMGNGCSSLVPLGYQSGQGCVMVGNDELKPEISRNYEIGFGYDNAGYALGMTYFKSNIKDMMQNGLLGRFGGTWYTQQYNIEEGVTEGIEATFAVPLNRTVTLGGNVTHMMESKNKTTGDRLSMTPEWTANATLNWRATPKLNAYMTVQHIGKQLSAAANNPEGGFVSSNTTLDLGATYNVHNNLSLRAGVQNVTNSVAKTDDDYGDGSPRTFFVGLTGRF